MYRKKIIVFYHGNCPDGFGGAWAAWKKLGNRAEYIPLFDRKEPPEGLGGKEIYFIDWIYPAGIMEKLEQENLKVVGIDHHASSSEAIKKTSAHLFDLKHSGAVLAWKYFHPGEPTPRLLRYVEDYDIWPFELPGTEAVSVFLETQKMNFKKWSRLARNFENPSLRKEYILTGRKILSYRDGLIREIVLSAKTVNFLGFEILAANTPVFRDQVGHALADAKPPFGLAWREERGEISVSLRSVPSFNLIPILKKFGGGGHPNAGGFSLPKGASLPWKEVKS